MKTMLVLMIGMLAVSCSNHYAAMQYSEPIQLTHTASGHTINSTQCFSPDGKWIVYDARNADSALASSEEIRMVHTQTREDVLLYRTQNQSAYGPGVGAATFSPDGKKVLFLGGLSNADSVKPYSTTRRTGIAVELAHPLVPVTMDARDIVAPFTSGALRGGTHAHTWSGDGQWISFTYNDFVLQQAAETNPTVKDLRTVGIMFYKPVVVAGADGVENKSGTMFSVLIAPVTPDPKPDSDDIQKAFDECWIGTDGYVKNNGIHQKKAIAFQGNVKDKNGDIKTEIFVADIPENLPSQIDGLNLSGTDSTLPLTPEGIVVRRISDLPKKGVSSTPRHWLRSSPDGSRIGFLMADKNAVIQLWCISPNGENIAQLSYMDKSISGPFNFSPDGTCAAFIADGSVFVADIKSKKSFRLTAKEEADSSALIGAVVWSPDGKELIYNRYVNQNNEKYLQIFLLKRKS